MAMDKDRMFTILRYIFLVLNGGIIIASVVGFILGNINFSSKFYFTGSFIGGQLACISLLFFVYGCLGIYAAQKRDKIAVLIYGVIVVVSLITRLLMWALAAMHGFVLSSELYAYIALELIIIILSGLLFYVLR